MHSMLHYCHNLKIAEQKIRHRYNIEKEGFRYIINDV